MNDYFKAAGMGRFSLLDSKEKTVQAIIRDPPLSERGEATGNHFIQGIVVGLIEAFQGREMRVMEDLYDSNTGRLFIVLLDKSAEIKVPVPDEVKVKALEEVEKVIRSIEGEQEPVREIPTETPVLSNASSPSLNQVLKTYQDEGWVGGKIGIAPEPSESSPPIVVKYPVPEMRQETPIEQPKLEAKQDALVEPPNPSIAQETLVPPKIEEPTKDSIPKEVKKSRKPTEEELEKAFKSALNENDSDYFDDSFLE